MSESELTEASKSAETGEPDIKKLNPASRVPRDSYEMQSSGDNPFCLRVETGTVRSTWRIENPAGIGTIPSAKYANYDQNILSQTATALEIELISRADLNTQAPYPVNAGALPSDVVEYLEPETMAQSHAPEIQALSASLVEGAETQARAVERVQAWVASQISYDYSLQLPNDAVSVMAQRSAVCSGYSWLTVALLRAAGIPARYTVGCVGWSGDSGTLHAWIEIYYPDAGWALSEPQESANFLHTPGYVIGLLGLCSSPNTTVTQLSKDDTLAQVVSLETKYTDAISPLVFAASVASVPRVELDAIPQSAFAWASLYDTDRSLDLYIKNYRCRNEDWRVESSSSWLQADPVRGLDEGLASLAYTASGIAPGRYQAEMDIFGTQWDLDPAMSVTQDFWMTKLYAHGGAPWMYDLGVANTDSDALGWPSFEATPRVVGDVNGDSRDDMIGFASSGTYVALSNGAQFSEPTLWIRNYGQLAGGWSSFDLYPRAVGDVNGDGRDDIVAFGNKATYVSLSTGSSFGAPQAWILLYGPSAGGWMSQDTYPRMLGDVNGDGKDDLVAFGNRATYVSLSTGSSFAWPVAWIFGYGPAAGGWVSQNVFPRMLGDVNGDGLEDIVAFGNRATYVSLSTGSSFGAPTEWIFAYGPAAGGWVNQETFPRAVGDVDGDGKDDIVAFGNRATYLSLSTGSRFEGITAWITGYGVSAGGWSGQNTYPRMLGDVSGDGRADAVGCGEVVTFVTLSNR